MSNNISQYNLQKHDFIEMTSAFYKLIILRNRTFGKKGYIIFN